MHKLAISSLARAAVFAGSSLLVVGNAHALTFSVVFGNDGTTGNFTSTQQAAVQGALNTIAGTYSDKVTVKLHIMNSASGLGGSSQNLYVSSYGTYRSSLIADAKDAIDTQATGSLGVANPFGSRSVVFTSALGRALGFSTAGSTTDSSGTYDCRIFLNAGLCFTGAAVGGKYDLAAVAMHEIDESMGFGGPGSLIGTSYIGSYVGEEDLFRYSGAGVRTNLSSNSVGNYFSVDGGVTNIRNFNNGKYGGDYADWASDGNAYVQNAFGTPGVAISYSSIERTAGDAIGWDLKPTPEPATMAALGLGVAALLRRRKKA